MIPADKMAVSELSIQRYEEFRFNKVRGATSPSCITDFPLSGVTIVKRRH